MEDVTLNIQSEAGIDLRSPLVSAFPVFEIRNYEPTWAERKRDDLVWKIKSRKANLNKLIVLLVMIPSVAIILAIILWLATILRNESITIMLGALGATLMIFSYYFWLEIFECDATHLVVKHKGKTYW